MVILVAVLHAEYCRMSETNSKLLGIMRQDVLPGSKYFMGIYLGIWGLGLSE